MWILFALMGAGLVAALAGGGDDEDDGTETRIGGGGGADALQDRAPDIIALSVIGTDEDEGFPDIPYGTDAADTFDLLGGDDVAYGNGGDDLMLLGAGDDFANAGLGADRVEAGPGSDFVRGSAGPDVLLGEDGQDLLQGESGNDQLFGGDDEDILFGGPDDDLLEGQNGDDFLTGGEGNDALRGGAGSDIINGAFTAENSGLEGVDEIFNFPTTKPPLEDSPDILEGGPGIDLLYGGEGDTLSGGSESDTFAVVLSQGFSNPVEILDAEQGESVIIDIARLNQTVEDTSVSELATAQGDTRVLEDDVDVALLRGVNPGDVNVSVLDFKVEVI